MSISIEKTCKCQTYVDVDSSSKCRPDMVDICAPPTLVSLCVHRDAPLHKTQIPQCHRGSLPHGSQPSGAVPCNCLRLHSSYKHKYPNAIPLDSWSISRDNTIPLVSLCVHRDAPAIPLGSPCIHKDAPSHKPPIKMSPSTFLPNPLFLYYISYKRQHVCACQVRGSTLRNFGRLVAYLCRVVSLCEESSRGAGPAWSSLAQDLHVSERHESGIRTVPLPGTLACSAPR